MIAAGAASVLALAACGSSSGKSDSSGAATPAASKLIVIITPSPDNVFFKAEQENNRFVQAIDRVFDRVHSGYARVLHSALSSWVVIVVMGFMLSLATVLAGMTAQSELAPEEDQGFLFYQLNGAPNATSEQMLGYAKQMFDMWGERLGITSKSEVST